SLISNDNVELEVRGVRGEHLEMGLRGEPVRLPRLRGQVQGDRPTRARARDRLRHLGDQEVRDHGCEPGTGAEDDPVRLHDRLDGLTARGWLRRLDTYGDNSALCGRDRDLSAHLA